jgi:hypothetical protein
MKKGVLIATALLVVLAGPTVLLAGSDCPYAKKAKGEGYHGGFDADKPCCAAAMKTAQAQGLTRTIHTISNGVLIVYSAKTEEGIAKVRLSAADGCAAHCSHHVDTGGEHFGCPKAKAAAKEAEARHEKCKNRAPKLAGMHKEVVQTADGAIVMFTTKRAKDVEALHAWAAQAAKEDPTARASL